MREGELVMTNDATQDERPTQVVRAMTPSAPVSDSPRGAHSSPLANAPSVAPHSAPNQPDAPHDAPTLADAPVASAPPNQQRDDRIPPPANTPLAQPAPIAPAPHPVQRSGWQQGQPAPRYSAPRDTRIPLREQGSGRPIAPNARPGAPQIPRGPSDAQGQPYTHVPWEVSSSWGSSSFNGANTAAGLSYLFWWISGLLIYFHERENRFVRFHAVQSILLTGALTVVSVLLYIVFQLFGDVAIGAHQPWIAHVGHGLVFLAYLPVVALWIGPMAAAWNGHYLRLPIVGEYAERYAAPPHESFSGSSPF